MGIRAGDVIISVGGIKTKDTGEAISQIGKNYKGDTIKIVILRGGVEIKMNVKLGERPDDLDK